MATTGTIRRYGGRLLRALKGAAHALARAIACCCGGGRACGECGQCDTARLALAFTDSRLAYMNGDHEVAPMGTPPPGWDYGYSLSIADGHGHSTWFTVVLNDDPEGSGCGGKIILPNQVWDSNGTQWSVVGSGGDIEVDFSTEGNCVPHSTSLPNSIAGYSLGGNPEGPYSGLDFTYDCLEWGA